MTQVSFGSVCSGIEAASVAWHPLGWHVSWLAEIEPFPSAVLAHHYPAVPNLGDMTKLARMVLAGEIDAPDVLVGGTPCQAYSVAGMRAGLNDERGQLTLRYMELADAIDFVRDRDGKPPCVIVWENVPGVLSDKTNAFGCFLAGLAGEDVELQPAGKRWTNAGCVFGPQRAIAWRTLDAQYLGLAQRRRRVFVVASARDGFDPAQVLFEWDGLRRDSAPSRGPGQNAAASTLRSTDGGSDVDHARARHLIAGTLQASGKAAGSATQQDAEAGMLVAAYGGNNTSGPIDVATARNACASASGRMDFETETFITQCVTGDVTRALKAEGADASEDGTGRGNPIVPVAFDCKASGQNGFGVGEIASTMRSMGHSNSHQNGGGHLAVAFAENSRAEIRLESGDGQVVGTLSTGGGKPGQGTPSIMSGMAVRRLTPRECERLQGFPDDYTLIPHGRAIRAEKLDADWIKYLMRGGRMTREECARAAADGPRYKALGNSMAIPVMAWIGIRVASQIKEAA